MGFLSSVSLVCQLKMPCSLTVNSVFQLCLESMACHHSYFCAFGPWLNVIEDPCSKVYSNACQSWSLLFHILQLRKQRLAYSVFFHKENSHLHGSLTLTHLKTLYYASVHSADIFRYL